MILFRFEIVQASCKLGYRSLKINESSHLFFFISMTLRLNYFLPKDALLIIGENSMSLHELTRTNHKCCSVVTPRHDIFLI